MKFFACSKCDRVFESEDTFFKHFKTKHKLKKRFIEPYSQIKCPFCEFCPLTGDRKNIYTHIRNMHKLEKENPIVKEMAAEYQVEDDLTVVQCQICGKSLKHLQILLNHIRDVHGGDKFTCASCGISVSCERNLTAHMITHNKPSIPCEKCGRLFKRNYDVKSHIKQFHLKVREFQCTQCEKRFSNAKKLNYHKVAVHDKVKPFSCDKCDFKCARNDNLAVHKRKKHKEI